MTKAKIVFAGLMSLGAGILMGGYLFSRSQPRSLLAINHCQNCLTPKDLLGLMASVGIQKTPGLMPFVVFETDKTIAIKLPLPHRRSHYVIIPKKDIKNIGEISEADTPYLTDAFFVARQVIEQQKLSKYEIYTNGPGLQTVTYLHFHLVVK